MAKPKTMTQEIAVVISRRTIFSVADIYDAHGWLGSWDAVLYAIDFAVRMGTDLITAIDFMQKVQRQ